MRSTARNICLYDKISGFHWQSITCIPPLKENELREPFFVSPLLPPLAANFVLIAPTIIEPKLKKNIIFWAINRRTLKEFIAIKWAYRSTEPGKTQANPKIRELLLFTMLSLSVKLMCLSCYTSRDQITFDITEHKMTRFKEWPTQNLIASHYQQRNKTWKYSSSRTHCI